MKKLIALLAGFTIAGGVHAVDVNTYNVSDATTFSGSIISATAQFLGKAGSATSPSYSFTADPNTGIYNSAANQIGFTTDGTLRWVINASGTLNAAANNTYDIGTTGALPRDLEVGRSVITPSITIGGGTALTTFTEAAYNAGWDFSYAGDTTGVTYTTKKGTYQRVGNWVTVTLQFTLSANGTAAGAPRIDGLPFAVNVTDTTDYPVSILCSNVVGLTGAMTGFATNAASIYLYQTAATGVTALDKTNFSNTTGCTIQVRYRI